MLRRKRRTTSVVPLVRPVVPTWLAVAEAERVMVGVIAVREVPVTVTLMRYSPAVKKVRVFEAADKMREPRTSGVFPR